MKLVTAAILTDNTKILIAKRSASDKLSNKWEFPGGKVEEGETPEACLIREIKEELDIKIEILNFFDESIYDYGSGCIKLLAYSVKYIDGEIKPYVHDEVKWVEYSELGNYDFAPADIPFVKNLTAIKGFI